MNKDKTKQYIAFIGGALGGILFFLQSLGIEFTHFNNNTIDAFVSMLESFVPLFLVGYGVYKNQYIITKQAKEQERTLKYKGMK